MAPRAQVKSSGSDRVSQVPWSVVIVPRVKPAGQTSAKTTPVAVDGPSLVTTISYAYVTPSPAVTVICSSVFATEMSALTWTAVSSVSLLSVPSGSNVPVVATVAVLLIGVPVNEASTLTT